MLKLYNVSKTFKLDSNPLNDKKALQNVSLTLKDGDFVTIIGGNGSGKTTLLNVIAGVYIPDNGTIIIDDENVTNLKEYQRAKYIGRVFQDPMLGTIADMTLIENLSLASRRGKHQNLAWAMTKKNSDKYIELLETLDLGLETRLNARMRTFSGGQRQSITLLMATMNEPSVLLLDEHTAALDPKTAKNVMAKTDEIVKKMKITTLMITHNMKDAIKYGNRLIMMSEGHIIFEASGKEKEKLTVEELIKKFNKASGDDELPDTMILSD